LTLAFKRITFKKLTSDFYFFAAAKGKQCQRCASDTMNKIITACFMGHSKIELQRPGSPDISGIVQYIVHTSLQQVIA